ncbi:MAG: helix-turn-helix domain-containing protein [Brevundimonas sp.]
MRASKSSPIDPKQSARVKFVWLRQVFTDPATGHLSCRVAGLLIDHINRATGEAWPSQARLAEAAGVTPRAIQYGLQKLISGGHLKVRRKRGLTNRYQPLLKPTNVRSPDGSRPTNAGSETDEPSFVRLLETPLKKALDEAEQQRLGREMEILARQLSGRSSRSGADA